MAWQNKPLTKIFINFLTQLIHVTHSSHLMTLFEGTDLSVTDPPKEWFNFGLVKFVISLRDVLELFVRRWGILCKPLEYKLPVIVKIVHACCRLHNFALKHKIPLRNKPIPIELEVDQEDVLLDNDWRHESHIKEVKEDINVGSF